MRSGLCRNLALLLDHGAALFELCSLAALVALAVQAKWTVDGVGEAVVALEDLHKIGGKHNITPRLRQTLRWLIISAICTES